LTLWPFTRKTPIPFLQQEACMPKGSSGAFITGIALNRDAVLPLYRQLYEGLRQAILTHRLAPGARLPSTRVLASELGISRYTVVDAFRQLYAEGYLEGKVGAGTYVTRTVPDDLLHPHQAVLAASAPGRGRRPQAQRSAGQVALSHQLLEARLQQPSYSQAFQVGVPALDAFPSTLWGQLVARHARALPASLHGYLHPAGYAPLRQAIATYLATARGVRCTAEQVIVVNGSQQGIALTAQVLLNPGEAAWMEDPGYPGAKGALLSAGARLIPVPIDAEGLDVEAGKARCAEARLAFVTPAHQCPLGVTMSLPRRLALLEWAQEAGAWIIEDDYDSEYRYVGRPFAALQGLDMAGRVIYAGTFSKVLFPALRLGYLVVPPDLVEAFVAARLFADMHSPVLEQAVVAEFITEGHFARHIRRMRVLYAERQAALVEAAQQLSAWLTIRPSEAGLHTLGWLPAGSDDQAIAQLAAQHQIITPPLSHYYIEPGEQRGLLLGYASGPIPAIHAGIRRLAAALSSSMLPS
jgi:GntR family transcriptional regulator/MocR family aminotransferase